MIFKAINRRIIIQMFTAIICSMLLISCDGESSSNTSEESSSNTSEENSSNTSEESSSNTSEESSSNTSEESSSNTYDGTTDSADDTVNQVECNGDGSTSVIIDGEEFCPDE
jgi:cytoskeletal protein RodZ